MQKIALIDNYDSFSYNIVHIVEKLHGRDVAVFKNDEIGVERLAEFDTIILSPGPGLPVDAGITCKVIEEYFMTKKILGICLGHQAIAEFFGAKLINLEKVFHGLSTSMNIIQHDSMFKDLPNKINVGRYHSWVVAADSLPADLIPLAFDSDKNLMAFAHRNYRVKGVQFHPESILTADGEMILKNWLAD